MGPRVDELPLRCLDLPNDPRSGVGHDLLEQGFPGVGEKLATTITSCRPTRPQQQFEIHAEIKLQ